MEKTQIYRYAKRLFYAVITSSVLIAASQKTYAQTPDTLEFVPKLYLVSNAHLDSQWKWTVEKSIAEYLPNTLWQNFRLLEKYPEYRFNFEGAVKYAWIKEYYPEEFRKVKEYVANGRWNVSGSSWEASDVMVPSTESIFRNILLGQEFYKKEFGVKSTDIMLPDCFGFTYALPSIASHCGLIGFSTQKLRYRDRIFYDNGKKWPFLFGIWQGIDGSKILAVTHGGAYNWNPDRKLSEYPDIARDIEASPIKALFRYYGTASSGLQADRGGSPLPSSMEYIMASMNDNNGYEIIMAASDRIFKDYQYLIDKDILPVYDGELLMDTHGTGCYSAIASMKRMNRENERLLYAAESISSAADWTGTSPYPSYQITDAAKRFLWHQFHDDLTGTSIPEAYKLSWNDELTAQNQLENAVLTSMNAVAGNMSTRVKGTPVIVFNPVSADNCDLITAGFDLPDGYEGVAVYGPDGKRVRTQITGRNGNRAIVLVESNSRSMEFATYDFRPSARQHSYGSNLKTGKDFIENDIYKISVDENGNISSIYDKRFGKELVLAGKALSIDVFENNVSDHWPSWEILKQTVDSTPVQVTDNVKISIDETGPLRACLKISRTYCNSTVTQRIMLTDGGEDDRIDIETSVDWNEKGKLMKATFPLAYGAAEATYDIGLGHVMRGNNTDTQYEVYAHQWADLTAEDGTYGVTILSRDKYGWDKPDDNTLRLTLFHSPTASKDRYTFQSGLDHGHHTFTYSIVGHRSALDPSLAAVASDILNNRKFTAVSTKHDGALGKTFSFASTSDNDLRIKCLKKAEDGDGFIIRVYEMSGDPEKTGYMTFGPEVESAETVNGIEEYIGKADFNGHTVSISTTAFAPKTFRVRFKDSRGMAQPDKYEYIALPYNKIAITSDAFPSIGKMDSSWRSYAAEIIPDTLLYNGIPFIFGEADLNNAVRCGGQSIILPEGSKGAYFLAAADDCDRIATFLAGTQEHERAIPYWTGFFGQDTMEGLPEPFLKQGNIAYVGTHRHNPSERNEIYKSTYMFLIYIPMDQENRQITLPDDSHITIFASTAVK